MTKNQNRFDVEQSQVLKMLRRLAVVFLCLLSVFPAFADPLDDLFIAAQARDTARAETILAAADTAQQRRDMMWMLGSNHVDLRAFTRDWVKADPDNPLALTARAWSIYREGFLIRGERLRRDTYPPLVDEAQGRFLEALGLARKATELDPRYLPASDAVIVINRSAGRAEDSIAELERIMALEPNRHSLVLTAGLLSPQWRGSEELMQSLCAHFASSVTDLAGFDADTCFAQAVLRADLSGQTRDWAITIITPIAAQPSVEYEALKLAREHALPFEGLEPLIARLTAEGRMSTILALSWTPDLLKFGPLPDKAGFETLLVRDLSEAAKRADRDPGSVDPLKDLIDLYQTEADFLTFQVLAKANPTEEESQAAAQQVDALRQRQAETLDRRARALLALAPYDSAALQFAVDHILLPDPDPLAADRWAMSLLTNAAVYANYQDRQVGRIIVESKSRLALLRERMAAGTAPTYPDADLDTVYNCPYVRAVRLLDVICANSSWGVENCLLDASQSAPSDSSLDYSPYAEIAKREACKMEREAPVEHILFDIVEVKPLP